MIKVLLLIVAYIVSIYLFLMLWIYFVTGGNWLKEEGRYGRNFVAVKLRLVKPIKTADIRKRKGGIKSDG